jgi:hypothetical protein
LLRRSLDPFRRTNASAAITQTANTPFDDRCGVVSQLHPAEEDGTTGTLVEGASAWLPASAALGTATQAPELQVWAAPHVCPHDPQFLLSVATLAQYGDPLSEAHKVEPSHVMPQTPPEQTLPEGHAFPQVPQLLLSVAVVVQYGAPPSEEVHRTCSVLQIELHLPPLQMWPLGQTLPQEPQLLLSLETAAQ